jgi:hypothetical protein
LDTADNHSNEMNRVETRERETANAVVVVSQTTIGTLLSMHTAEVLEG